MTIEVESGSRIFSSFILHPNNLKIEDYGSFWGEFNDVCMYYKNDAMLPVLCLFVEDISLYEKIKDLFFEYKLYPLAFNYVLFNQSRKTYISAVYKNEGNTWVVPLSVPHQIFHFLDNYILLWNSQFDKNIPKVDNIINVAYDRSVEYEYSYFTYQLITKPLRSFKAEMFRSDIMKNMRKLKTDMMCFDRIYIPFKSFYCKFGVIFPSNNRRKIFRDSCYNMLNIHNNKNKINNKLEICIILRNIKTKSRSLLNVNEIKSFIKSLNYDFNVIIFEDLPVDKQIKSIMNTNIIISVMGSGLTNLFWMGNKVFLIQMFNYFYIHSDFVRISMLNNYGYISLFSNDRCNDEKDHYQFISEGCGEFPMTFSNTYSHFLECNAMTTIFDDLKIRVRQFQFAFRYAIHYFGK